MKRTIVILTLVLAATFVPAQAANTGTTTAKFRVTGNDLPEIQAKATAILTELDGSVAWSVDYVLRQGRSVPIGGGRFSHPWIARATATAL
jgi:hypothetical protein